MKNKFAKPFCEVVRFNDRVISTSTWCYCDACGIFDYGPGEDDGCPGQNNPRCRCENVDPMSIAVNCI